MFIIKQKNFMHMLKLISFFKLKITVNDHESTAQHSGKGEQQQIVK